MLLQLGLQTHIEAWKVPSLNVLVIACRCKMLCAGRNVLAQQQSHRPACTTSNTHRLVVPKHRAAVVVASTTADQARTTLRQGIAQQLTGPHFDTWVRPHAWRV